MAKYDIQIIEVHDNFWKITTNDEDIEPFYVLGADASEAHSNARKHIRKLEDEADEEYKYILAKVVKIEHMGELLRFNEQRVPRL